MGNSSADICFRVEPGVSDYIAEIFASYSFPSLPHCLPSPTRTELEGDEQRKEEDMINFTFDPL